MQYRNIYVQYKSQPNLNGIYTQAVCAYAQYVHSNKMCVTSNNTGSYMHV